MVLHGMPDEMRQYPTNGTTLGCSSVVLKLDLRCPENVPEVPIFVMNCHRRQGVIDV
jgi:hypothetical protein